MESKISVSNFLKEKFEEKQLQNKNYSLRAFAARIGLSPGGLVQILSEKKKLSIERSYDLAKKLQLTAEEKKIFYLLVEFEQSKKAERKAAVLEELTKLNIKGKNSFFDLGVDQFKVISDWYGLAVLECITSYGKGFNSKDLAKHFGITAHEALMIVDRLQRLELIEKNESGEWVRIHERVLITSQVPNEAIKNYYKSVSKKSAESYETQTPQEKVSAAETFSFDPGQIEELRKLTDDYLNSVMELSNRSQEKTATYQALVNVFRLNSNKKEKL